MDSKGVTAFDVVLHDGVGKKKRRNRDGAQEATTHTQSALAIDALRLATMFLAPEGAFITKFIRSQDLDAIKFCLKQLFEKVQPYKPIASPIASSEIYFVCLEYKAPAKIQPELFDLNYLFTVSLENKPRDEVETKFRGICRYESMSYFKRCPASQFVWSEADIRQELVSFFVEISFDDPASLPIKNHELTTIEIIHLCSNLNALDKNSLNHVLKWRTCMRKALSSCSQVTPKADVTAVDAKVKDDDQLLDKKEELTSIIDRKTRRDKGQ
uniref:Uncharacterized protein n=1 Tax=Avena sativa TaxID=4498 RepID=A0ACD5XYY7_AVESA